MADYGLQITGTKYGQEKVIFDSRESARGTYQSSKGTLAFGSSIITKFGDLLMINLTRPSSGSATVLITAVKTQIFGVGLRWTFNKEQLGGNGQTGAGSITGVNYVVLRDAANSPAQGDYGIVCNDGGVYGSPGPVSFDSRMFASSEGEVQIDPRQVYMGRYAHGVWLARGWNGADEFGSEGEDYYNAEPLEFSSMTGGTRKYGYVWTTVSSPSVKLYSTMEVISNYPNFQSREVGFLWTTSEATSNGGVYHFAETNSGGHSGSSSSIDHPVALSQSYAARKTLGTYDPQ
tara:strand:- start:2450 stop:3319 length:870 start_codon:yes stop_codon:yes gene_type:complete